jgi:hypothetical protein
MKRFANEASYLWRVHGLPRRLLAVGAGQDYSPPTGHAAAKAGTLGSTIEKLVSTLKPEAAYFYADDEGQSCESLRPGGLHTESFR